MKVFISFILVMQVLVFNQAYTQNNKESMPSIYNSEIKLKSLTGEEIDLNQFKGKKVLIVNVASKCGFTPQYKGLQELHAKYKEKIVVLGVPCNQYGGQEPGTSDEIVSFCEKNYGVEFLMAEKINVKGEDQHPLYGWLTSKENNGLKNSSVKWNFQKYLLNESGELIDVYYSTTKPMSDKIVSKL